MLGGHAGSLLTCASSIENNFTLPNLDKAACTSALQIPWACIMLLAGLLPCLPGVRTLAAMDGVLTAASPRF